MQQIRSLAYASEFAALIGVFSLIVIPIGPVPITLQVLFIAYAGLVLGPKRAMLAVLIYLLAGSAGLPIFAGGKAGLGVLFGPSGGFLFGFLILAFFAGLAKNKSLFNATVLLFLGLALDHALGIASMSITLKKTFIEAFYMDLIFLPGDAIKIALSLFLWQLTRKRLSL